MLKQLKYWFDGLFTCRVYVGCKMTNRNRREMIARAKRVCEVFRRAGIEAISPVLRERVQNRPGVLKNPSKLRLFKKWTDDKNILCWEAHGMVWDQATDKSFGAEREYGISRYLWWKPTAIIVPTSHGLTVAEFEDDLISGDEEAVAHYFATYHGNLYKRWKWRFRLLNQKLVKFVAGQIWQWVH